jgi:hypothetical protein
MSRISTLAACAALALSGCGEDGKVFGFDRSGPDEFTVVRNQPLSMPPDATLRPPQAGTARSTRDRSSNEARDSLLTSAPGSDGAAPGASVTPQYPQATAASPGEVALTRRVAAYYGVEPDIRRVVDQESHRLALEQEGFLHEVLFWQDPPPPGTALDATAESRRLRENEALGKPANSGTAPVIVRKKSGLSSLF